MDKKVYNKPSLKLEIFTPNEYIATCWYIAEGDCYSGTIYTDKDDNKETFRPKNLPSFFNRGHGSHRVPDKGYFRTDGSNPVLEPQKNTVPSSEYWWTGGYIPNGNSELRWDRYEFTRIEDYYKYAESSGKVHYFDEISYASNKNATS